MHTHYDSAVSGSYRDKPRIGRIEPIRFFFTLLYCATRYFHKSFHRAQRSPARACPAYIHPVRKLPGKVRVCAKESLHLIDLPEIVGASSSCGVITRNEEKVKCPVFVLKR